MRPRVEQNRISRHTKKDYYQQLQRIRKNKTKNTDFFSTAEKKIKFKLTTKVFGTQNRPILVQPR